MKKNNLLSRLKEGMKVIVCVSGGPDSMFLLHLLKNYPQDIKIVVAHVNHKTREECDKEADMVKSYCENNNLTFEQLTINEYRKGRFTEEEAREIRFAFFKKLQQQYQADYVITAHHLNDLAESIIMKILRGSTLKSLVGIKEVSVIDGVCFYRPLLSVTKEEIMAYVKEQNIPYAIDKTNDLDNHLRNRLRHQVIPLLQKEEKQFFKKMSKLSKEIENVTNYIERQILAVEEKIKKNGQYDLTEFIKLDEFLQKEIIKKELKQLYQEKVNVCNENDVEKIIKFLNGPRKKNTLLLPLNYELKINKNSFYLEKKKNKENYCIECKEITTLPTGIVYKILDYQQKSNFEIHLNSKEIKLPLYITTRQKGMKMKVKNLLGTKKVKDILIDAKIADKDEVPIMIDSENKVIWILGVKKSEYDREKNENYDIIYRYERKELF